MKIFWFTYHTITILSLIGFGVCLIGCFADAGKSPLGMYGNPWFLPMMYFQAASLALVFGRKIAKIK